MMSNDKGFTMPDFDEWVRSAHADYIQRLAAGVSVQEVFSGALKDAFNQGISLGVRRGYISAKEESGV